MTVGRSVALFVVAALFEIGGAWLVWQGIRENKGWIWIGAGIIALGLYGVVATWQHDDNFGRILAAYGGIFVAGSIAWFSELSRSLLCPSIPSNWDAVRTRSGHKDRNRLTRTKQYRHGSLHLTCENVVDRRRSTRAAKIPKGTGLRLAVVPQLTDRLGAR